MIVAAAIGQMPFGRLGRPPPESKLNPPLCYARQKPKRWRKLQCLVGHNRAGRPRRIRCLPRNRTSAAESFIDFPPMQKSASFNLEGVKEQIIQAMKSHHGH